MARTPTPNTGTTTITTDAATSQGDQTGGNPTDTSDSTPGGDDTPDPDPAELVDARVTLEFEDYAVNEVVELPAGRVSQLEREGYIDTHPDAVAYARSLVS